MIAPDASSFIGIGDVGRAQPRSRTAGSVSILIPTHNRATMLRRTLDGLSRIMVPAGLELELLVVANGCTDDTGLVCDEMLSRFPFPARWVTESRLGVSNARNAAMHATTGTLCIFLDDDVFVPADWLLQMLAAWERLPADIIGGRIDLEWETARPAWLSQRFDCFLSANDLGEEPRELASSVGVVGANFGMSRDVYRRFGPFRSHVGRIGSGLMGYDESELIDRALRGGCRAFYAPHARLAHWTPDSRARPEYVCRIAAGCAQGRVVAKTRFGVYTGARCLLGHAWLFAKGALPELFALPSRDVERILGHRVLRITGQAGFAAAVRRLVRWETSPRARQTDGRQHRVGTAGRVSPEAPFYSNTF